MPTVGTRPAGVRPVHRDGVPLCLALMAKPQVITFPFLLLLWDYWPLGRFEIPEKLRLARAAQSVSRS